MASDVHPVSDRQIYGEVEALEIGIQTLQGQIARLEDGGGWTSGFGNKSDADTLVESCMQSNQSLEGHEGGWYRSPPDVVLLL